MVDSNLKYSGTALRWGLALTLLWSVKTKLVATEQVVGMMEALGLSFLASPGIVVVLAFVLLAIAASLVFDWETKLAGLALTVFFLVSLIAGLFAGDGLFSVGPAIWKDLGLLGASIALVFWPSGGREEKTEHGKE